MTSYPAQYGFEAFSVPDYSLELQSDDRYRFTINEGELKNEWIDIYDLKFSDDFDENGQDQLLFDFNTSLGEDNVGFNELAQKLIKEVIIRTMESVKKYPENELEDESED